MCRLITAFELQTRSTDELSALFRKVPQQLARSEPGTAERRNAVASLENINRALTARYAKRFMPPGVRKIEKFLACPSMAAKSQNTICAFIK